MPVSRANLRLAAAWAALACVAGCRVGEGRIAREIRAQAAGGRAEIRVAELTPFAWDRLCLFGPYTTRKQAEACLGFPWPDFDETGLEAADTFSLMVFASSARVVHAEHVDRDVDFSNEILNRPFRRDEAIFGVVGVGERWKILARIPAAP